MPKIRRKHIGRRLKSNQKLTLSKHQKALKESESEQESNKRKLQLYEETLAVCQQMLVESNEKLNLLEDSSFKQKRVIRDLEKAYKKTGTAEQQLPKVIRSATELSPDMPRSTYFKRVSSVNDGVVALAGGESGRTNYIVHASKQLRHPQRLVSVDLCIVVMIIKSKVLVAGSVDISSVSIDTEKNGACR